MGGVANIVSGIQQGLKAVGGLMGAIGQFVPQFKQIGSMLNQASDAFSVMSKINDKADAEEAGKDAAKAGVSAPPVPTGSAADPLAGTGYNNLQEVQAASGTVNGVLDAIKSGNFDPASILSALAK